MSFTNNQMETTIIGIDHGYGNIKTARTCFQTGVTAYEKEPTFKSNLLVYQGRYYTIGGGHKEFTADKMADDDYYILTLAAIGRELNYRKLTSARIHIAAGLPLTWVSEQKIGFRSYLLQNDTVDFSFRGVGYHVEFAGADVFPQGFSAIVDKLSDFRGVNMLCDIGNGTSSAQAPYSSLLCKHKSSFIPLRLLSPQSLRTLRGPRFPCISTIAARRKISVSRRNTAPTNVCSLSARTSCGSSAQRWTTRSSSASFGTAQRISANAI